MVNHNGSFVSVVNFSSGILGSTSIKKGADNSYIINGDFIKKPVLNNINKKLNIVSLAFEKSRFKLIVKSNKSYFIIQVLDPDKKTSDNILFF